MPRGTRKDGRPNCLAKPLLWEIDDKGCWNVIKRFKDETGRTMVRSNGRSIRSHIFIYEECFGFIPDGQVVRHKCDNPTCINPEHLELGTQLDNIRDSIHRDRHARGERNGHARLNEEQVREIHALLSEGNLTQGEIGNRYGVGATMVCQIKRGHSWRHLHLEAQRELYKPRLRLNNVGKPIKGYRK